MKSVKITKENHSKGLKNSDDSVIVRGKQFNDLLDDLNAHIPADGVGKLDYLVPKSGDNLEILGQKFDPKYVTGDMTLTAGDSGNTYWIQGDSAGGTVTLPAAIPGLKFKFVWAANNDNPIAIQTADLTDTTGDMIRGGLLICAAAAVNTFVEAAGNVNSMTFEDDINNCASGAGSWLELHCVNAGIWVLTGVMNGNTDIDGVGSAIFSDAD
jgi:hypothetical protein